MRVSIGADKPGLKEMVLPEKESFLRFPAVAAIADRNHLNAGAGQTITVKPQLFRGARGYIQMPASNKWPTVVDAEFNRFPVL